MSIDVEEILERGSLDDIEKLIDSAGDDGEIRLPERELETATPEAEAQAEAPPAAEPPPQEQKEQPPVILAKDGVNVIPYSAIEAERAEKAALKAQLAEISRTNELLKAQLTEHDIKPKELPENVRFTAEQLADMENYGEIGAYVAVLAQQNAVLMERLASMNAAPPQEEAIVQPDPVAANPDLSRWAQSDSEWAIAESVDTLLQRLPEWAGKSLQERIPEIVRRTKIELKEIAPSEIERRAEQAIQNAQPRTPNSLTDVGGEVPGSSKTTREQLEDASTEQVEAFIAKQIASGKSMDQVMSSLLS